MIGKSDLKWCSLCPLKHYKRDVLQGSSSKEVPRRIRKYQCCHINNIVFCDFKLELNKSVRLMKTVYNHRLYQANYIKLKGVYCLFEYYDSK